MGLEAEQSKICGEMFNLGTDHGNYSKDDIVRLVLKRMPETVVEYKDLTFGGDNLHTAIWAATKTGFVIDGSIRDLNGVMKLASAGYYRGATPTSYREVMLTGINVPVRIGSATVLPGDIVVERGSLRFYFPIVTSLLISALLTLAAWLFRR